MAAGADAEGAACGGRERRNGAGGDRAGAGAPAAAARIERAGFIEIEFGSGARVCIRGEVAPKTLRQVIELLR